MSPEIFNEIIRQLDPGRTELIVLHSDGEPLLNPHIFEMIRSAKHRGFQVMTSTNATLMDEAVAREFMDSGLDVLTLSIDGITADVYEYIRKGANFQQVIGNIKRFLEKKGAAKPFTILQMIKMKENEHQTDDFLRSWQPYKNKNTHAVVKPMTDWFEEHPEIIDRLKFCDRPWFGMVVQSSGNVVPCVHDYDGIEVLGRLPEDNIYDIWNSENMVNLRRGILNGRRGNKLCKKCNATPPRGFGLPTALGLTTLDMKTVAKTLAIIGYNRPKQY
jgi:radical SAM protein with 4Fe4S-binding SPASM domain